MKTTIFLADVGDFAAVNAIYAKVMPDPPPARSTVGVGGLPKGALVEVEAIARRSRGRRRLRAPDLRLTLPSGHHTIRRTFDDIPPTRAGP